MLDSAVRDTIAAGKTTRDLGGTLSTDEFTKAVCATMRTELVGQADG
jgi:isocitrate/isopropylmalate dehydrogenase